MSDLFQKLMAKGEPSAFDFPSKAVIASDGKGNGCILCYVGEHLRVEIDAAGHQLDCLGLDDAPSGISVWEGKYVGVPGSYEYPWEGDSEVRGSFRDPTPEEWVAIKANECPWEEPGDDQ